MTPDQPAAAPHAMLTGLKAAHLALMDNSARTTDEIRAILARGAANGTALGDPSDRREAQRIVDYWSAELLGRRDIGPQDFNPTVLAAFSEESAIGAGDAHQEATDLSAISERGSAAREVVRLAALARQWRDAGQAPGYLLQGAALLDAARHVDKDRDIAALVTASEAQDRLTRASQTRTRRLVITALSALCLLASLAALFSYQQWQAARGANADLSDGNAVLAKEKADLQALILASRDQEAASAARIEALIQEQATLTKALHAQVESGAIAPQSLSPDLRTRIDNALPATSVALSPPLSADIRGYDASFLALEVPLPSLSPRLLPFAANRGQPLVYPNFSLVQNGARRMAFFVAANLQRDMAAPEILSRGTLRLDPRLAPETQAPPDWAMSDTITLAPLVAVQDIVWGPYFTNGGPDRLADTVDLFVSAAPQQLWFAQGPWAALQTWVATKHNPTSPRVTLLTGPILRDDDPSTAGVPLPRGFWAVAVSRKTGTGGLIVDAFVLWQDGEPFAGFDPDLNRVDLAAIERLTGLTFAAILHGLESGEAAPTPTRAEGLAARIQELGATDPATSGAAADDIAAALHPGALPADQVFTLTTALVEAASAHADDSLGAAARARLFQALSTVPAAMWSRPDWSGLRALTRRAIGDVLIAAQTKDIPPPPEPLLEALRITPSPGPLVYIQFSDLSREKAQSIGEALAALGWKVQPEERVSQTPSNVEVRFGPSAAADADAAALLAADLVPLGQAGARAAKLKQIGTGTLEVWLP